MNARRNSARALLVLGLGGVVLGSVVAAPPSAGDLAHCAAIASPDERLACYDTLAGRAPAPQPRAAPKGDKAFGLTKPVPAAAPEVPELIQARVTKVNDGGFNNASVYVVLDNGQTWTVEAPDVRLKAGDAVTIKRAALGSYLLISGKHSYRVRRLQ
jgi:hypothetical protein